MLARTSRLIAAGFLLLAALAAPALAAPLTPEQKQAVEQTIHDYLLNNPDVLIDALRNVQKASEAKAAELARKAVAERHSQLSDDPADPVGGNPEGDVTIVEFFDYRCPYCKQVEPSLEALLKEDPKLRIVYKEFPVLGQVSVYATHVALAARQQGKYAAFHRAMMAARGKIDQQTVLKVAASVGLDLERLKKDMAAPEIGALIQRNYDLAEALDIQGTPTFIVGDTLVPGAADADSLRKLVAAARKAG